MSRFETDLILRDLGDGRHFEVMSPLVYVSDLLGGSVVVDTGTITDLASIPFLPRHRTWSRAAVVHDGLYQSNGVTRKQADDVLREAMIVLDVPAWRRGVVYIGVRVGGWKAWDKHRAKEGV